jgi:drug/metabolite transporter (DMT)-like permease
MPESESETLRPPAGAVAIIDAGKRTALVKVHFAVLLAGATCLFAKSVASASLLTCGRTALAGIALALVAGFTRTSLRVRNRRDLGLFALAGLLLALHWYSFFESIRVSTVAVGLLAFSMYPLFTTLLEPVFFGEKLHRLDVVAALLVVGGLALVTPRFDLGDHLVQGILWGALSAFTCAGLALLSRSGVRGYPAITVTFYQQVFAFLGILPLSWLRDTMPDARSLAMLAVLGILFTAFPQGLVISGLRHLKASVVGMAFGLEPVYGILLAFLLLDETPSARTLAGGVVICGAVGWSSWRHASA